MKLAGLPIFPVMKNNSIPWIYSSWGSDVYYYKELGLIQKRGNGLFEKSKLFNN